MDYEREEREQIRIPQDNPDLIRYALLTNVKRGFGFLAWVAVWGLAFYHYFSDRYLSSWIRLGLSAVAVLVAGWILFEMKKFLFERSFRGKVLSIKVRRTYGRVRGANGKKQPRYYEQLVFVVEAENGKKKKLVVPQKNNLLHCYKVGRTITHYRGLTYPIAKIEEDNSYKICAVCGRTEKEGKDRCRACDRTLIQPERANEFDWWYARP